MSFPIDYFRQKWSLIAIGLLSAGILFSLRQNLKKGVEIIPDRSEDVLFVSSQRSREFSSKKIESVIVSGNRYSISDIEVLKDEIKRAGVMPPDSIDREKLYWDALIMLVGPTKSIEFAQELPTGRSRYNIIALSLLEIAKTDRIAAVFAYRKLDQSLDVFPSTLQNLFQVKSKSEADLIYSQIMEVFPPGDERQKLLYGFICEVGQKDLSYAKKFLEQSNLDDMEKQKIDSALFKMEIADSPEAAFIRLRDMPIKQSSEYAEMLSQTIPLDKAESYLDWIHSSNISYDVKSDSILKLVGRLAASDIDNAMQVVTVLTPSNISDNAFSVIARVAAERDISEAISVAKSIESVVSQEIALKEVYSVYARKSPAEALNILMQESRSEVFRSEVGSIIVYNWALSDPGSAKDWIAIDQGNKRPIFIEAYGLAIAQKDPTAFINASRNDSSFLKNDMAVSVAISRSVVEDPSSTAAWVMRSGLGTPTRIEVIANKWMDSDPISASKWIGAIPDVELRDVAVSVLVEKMYKDDPDLALEWANGISNAKIKENSLSTVIEFLNEN